MNCYIASQKRIYDLPNHLNKENTLYFPETIMTTIDMLFSSRPSEFHIVTDCHFLVSLYDRTEVFIYNKENEQWENPDIQTYGRSYDLILSELWKYNSSIPMAIINGEVTNVMGRKIKK